VPALGPKVAIIFHLIAYTLLKFVLDIELNFIHIYGVLFVIEISIMLLIGYWWPTPKDWVYESQAKVSLVPWRYAKPVSVTMLALIVIVYLIFSPIGLVGGLSGSFWPLVLLVVGFNSLICWHLIRRHRIQTGMD
jgi:SSS family solute:Na+ symporter